jgi:hypothetical protein
VVLQAHWWEIRDGDVTGLRFVGYLVDVEPT